MIHPPPIQNLDQIVANRIRTPDGTILQSFHRHDYKTYVDKNGQEYMVDGGNDYIRRIVAEEPYEELSVTLRHPYEEIREAFHWGTRGRDGKEPLSWKALRDLSTEHIEAILDTQTHLEAWVMNLFNSELKYRNQ
jgi:hypothetical protein